MILRVSTDGNDTGDGTTTPFRTIARAQAVARPGDTILCHPGNHGVLENLGAKSGTEGAYVKYVGQPGASLEGSSRRGGSARFDGVDWWWLEGFELQADRGSRDRGRGIRVTDCRHFVIRKNSVTYCEYDGINTGFCHHGLIEKNEVDGAGMVVVDGIGGHPIYISASCSYIDVLGNVLKNGNGSGLQGNGNLANTSTTHGFPVTGWIEKSRFIGNVIVDCGSIGGALINLDRCRDLLVDRNLAFNIRDLDCGGVTVFNSTGSEGSDVTISRLTLVALGRQARHGVSVMAGNVARVEKSIIIAEPLQKVEGDGQVDSDARTIWAGRGGNRSRSEGLALFKDPDSHDYEVREYDGVGWTPDEDTYLVPPEDAFHFQLRPFLEQRAAVREFLNQSEAAHARTCDALIQALALHREEGQWLSRARES